MLLSECRRRPANLSLWLNGLCSTALALADYVSFRDRDSMELVQSTGFAGKSWVSADCVYALEFSPPPASSVPGRAREARWLVFHPWLIATLAFIGKRTKLSMSASSTMLPDWGVAG